MINPTENFLLSEKTRFSIQALCVMVVLLVVRMLGHAALPPIFLLIWTFLVLGSVVFCDLKYRVIPNGVILPAIVIALVTFPFNIYGHVETIMQAYWLSSLGLVGCGLIFTVIYLSSHRGIGGGDVKLAGFIGATFGVLWSPIVIMIGIGIAALLTVRVLINGNSRDKERLPLGAALAIGGLGVLCWEFSRMYS